MTAERVTREVGTLQRLDLEGLREEWRRRWGPPPSLRSRDLMARAMAYRVQAAAMGDLPATLRRRMSDYAARFRADRAFSPTPGPALQPGSTLIREWHGVRHEVTVTETGFVYDGEAFRSLSQVARKITGVKWNGPVFFAVKARAGKRP